MSELIIEDDPDPLSFSINGYNINLETGKAYDGYNLSADLRKREIEYLKIEAKEREKRAVGHLSTVADRVFKEYTGVGTDIDETVHSANGLVSLRRHRMERKNEEGRMIHWSLYFFNDKTEGQQYSRSWWSTASVVNWSGEENRHESATDVEQRLELAFPSLEQQPAVKYRRFGGRVLARIAAL